MPSIWENPFANAHLKIERANKHIADIEERICSSPDAYAPSVKIDANTGQQFLYYGPRDRTFQREIALITGDTIHNLHCALDISWRAALRVISPTGFDPTRTKFPVSNDRKHLESSLTKTAKISDSSPLFDFMVNRVKSYKGGDSDVCAVHQLDIDDKHHLLVPVAHIVSIDGVELQNERGEIDVHTFVARDPLLTHRILIPIGSNVKNEGCVSIRVSFQEGEFIEECEVIPTLQRFSAKVVRIVRYLQRMAQGTHGDLG